MHGTINMKCAHIYDLINLSGLSSNLQVRKISYVTSWSEESRTRQNAVIAN